MHSIIFMYFFHLVCEWQTMHPIPLMHSINDMRGICFYIVWMTCFVSDKWYVTCEQWIIYNYEWRRIYEHEWFVKFEHEWSMKFEQFVNTLCEAWTHMVYEAWVTYEARVNCVHSVTYEQWMIWILWMMNDLWRTNDKQCAFYEWFVHSTFYMFFHDVSLFVDLRIFKT